MRPPETDAPRIVTSDSGAQRTDSTPIVQPPTDARKRQATLVAEAAFLGIALFRLSDGRWLASRWNLTKEIDDDQVEGWLRRIGGAA